MSSVIVILIENMEYMYLLARVVFSILKRIQIPPRKSNHQFDLIVFRFDCTYVELKSA